MPRATPMSPVKQARIQRLRKIRQLIANGWTQKEIASAVGLTLPGLRDLLYRVLKKDGCVNSAQWACNGIREGVIQ